MVILLTSDKEKFEVARDVAERSVLLKNLLEGMQYSCGPLDRLPYTINTLHVLPTNRLHLSYLTDVGENNSEEIPVSNVNASVMRKVGLTTTLNTRGHSLIANNHHVLTGP